MSVVVVSESTALHMKLNDKVVDLEVNLTKVII